MLKHAKQLLNLSGAPSTSIVLQCSRLAYVAPCGEKLLVLRAPKVDLGERGEREYGVGEGEANAEDVVDVREAREQREEAEGLALPYPATVEILLDLGAIAVGDLLGSGLRQLVDL